MPKGSYLGPLTVLTAGCLLHKFIEKSRACKPLFDKLQTFRADNNIGMRFDLSSCMTTSSEAIRPIFPKIPLAVR